VERINLLLAGARRVFDQLRYFNIVAKLDDGTLGWPEHGPYDAIIVTAGGPEVPEPLVDQLVEGGRLVIPVGDQHLQVLQLLEKKEEGVQVRELEKVRFVDLVGEHGWK
jgi:protein-L-isoaspartate(D-aspartate) O-methyltransferase